MLHLCGACANLGEHDKSFSRAGAGAMRLCVHAQNPCMKDHHRARIRRKRIMTAGEVLDIGAEAIWVMLGMAAPVMLIGLAVGVLIALFQALTQVQEMTLVFVPKIIVIFLALLIFLPMMGALLNGFMQTIADRIVAG
jgi:flagellar biosynthetic protein FliQ